MATVTFVLAGAIKSLGLRGLPSGIFKTPLQGPCFVDFNGLTADAQADLKHHGGKEKALHHYAYDHYAAWRDDIGANPSLNDIGAFGENLSTTGVTEGDIAVGDTFAIGTAIIQVSQGRQPCWKLNARFEVPDMALRVQNTGRTGWYYRVLQAGYIEAGNELRLVDRLSPEWTIKRLWHALYVDRLNFDELQEIAGLTTLAENWRAYAAKRIETRKVEDWDRRLNGQ